MKLDLYINEANDYARDIRVPVLHPHVAIIHYDEAGETHHTMNRIECYGIFLQREFPENLTYGIGTYHDGDGSLLAFAPGQVGGKRDDGTRRQYHGWVLLFDPVFIHGTEIERRMKTTIESWCSPLSSRTREAPAKRGPASRQGQDESSYLCNRY